MSLVDLKKEAKVHRPPIKYYYVKSRKELVEILSQKEMPPKMIKEKLRIQDLRQMAVSRNLPNIWRMRRAELMEILYPDPQENNKNDHHAEKHDDPQACEGQ